MQYFYFTYTCAHGGRGSMALPQHDGPNGFNLAEAHAYLHREFGCIFQVDNWFEINEHRFNEYKNYCEQMKTKIAAHTGQKPVGPVLQLHQGGKDDAKTKEEKPT